jgi:hypothetical protein
MVSICGHRFGHVQLHEAYARKFRGYGAYVARHPAMVLIFGVVILTLLCFGIFQADTETRYGQ